MGKIISAHEAPTHLSFTIDDGTGKIELSYWTSNDDDQEQVQGRFHWLLNVSAMMCNVIASPHM